MLPFFRAVCDCDSPIYKPCDHSPLSLFGAETGAFPKGMKQIAYVYIQYVY